MRRNIIVVTDLDQHIEDLVRETDKKTLAAWAADCAERVLPFFEERHSDDPRPRKAIEACREWIRTGVFRMAEVRKTALAAHAAAREVPEYDPARSAARAAGQALATTHVPAHAIAAARYAATAVRDAASTPDAGSAATREREWQERHLLRLREQVAS